MRTCTDKHRTRPRSRDERHVLTKPRERLRESHIGNQQMPLEVSSEEEFPLQSPTCQARCRLIKQRYEEESKTRSNKGSILRCRCSHLPPTNTQNFQNKLLRFQTPQICRRPTNRRKTRNTVEENRKKNQSVLRRFPMLCVAALPPIRESFQDIFV